MSGPITGMTVERVESVLVESARDVRELLACDNCEAAGRNPSGDDRIAADAAADSLLVDRLADVGGVGEVASEEREATVDAGEGLAVTVDPLDGSQNLRTNNPTGTIVGVYDADLPARGRDLVAAGFVVYGPTTTATIARSGSVTRYEVGDDERRVLDRDLRLPEDPTVYGLGGGDDDWPAPVAAVAEDVRESLKLRYSGALVADVSQVLLRGGLFGYPQLESRPQGKLRHQFEVNPIAFVVETAGGASTDGARSVLDRPPAGLHARAPTYVGNEEWIGQVEARLLGTNGATTVHPASDRR